MERPAAKNAAGGTGREPPMTLRWSYIERNRETELFAERLSRRIHAIALVLTAIVLAMRLVAGREDLTSDADRWEDTRSDGAVEAQPFGASQGG